MSIVTYQVVTEQNQRNEALPGSLWNRRASVYAKIGEYTLSDSHPYRRMQCSNPHLCRKMVGNRSSDMPHRTTYLCAEESHHNSGGEVQY